MADSTRAAHLNHIVGYCDSCESARDRLERESLRRQYALLAEIRDRMAREPSEWYDAWAEALVPLTDRVIHALMRLEGVPPYPHPIGTWEEIVASGTGFGATMREKGLP